MTDGVTGAVSSLCRVWLWREWVRWVSAMGVCSRHFESEQASGMSDKRVRVKLRMSMVLVDVWV